MNPRDLKRDSPCLFHNRVKSGNASCARTIGAVRVWRLGEAIDGDLRGQYGRDRKTSAQVGKHYGLIEVQGNTGDITAEEAGKKDG